MIIKIEIHDLITYKTKVLKSGDNKTWMRLSDFDKNGIKLVLEHKNTITVGKTIYKPIFK